MVSGPASTVLVTGARGFLGPRVVAELLAAGYTVVEYNRETVPAPGRTGHTVEQGELDDIPRLLRVLREHRVACIAHLAAQSHPDVSLVAPWATMAGNVLGSTGVLEAARAAEVKRVVLIGSESAYGETDKVAALTEDMPFRPTTPYGVSKAAVDLLGHVYRSRYALDVIVLRIGQIYGPGQRLPEDIHDLIRLGLDTGAIVCEAGGDQELELIHVDDAARAVLRSITVGEHASTAYNISAGQTTLGMLAEVVAGALGVSAQVGPGRKGYDFRAPFSRARAHEELRFEASISLEVGVASYVDWLRRHPF
jgi:UDP-glucose 4-epimerase